MLREDEKLPFTSHLEELRSRLIKSFIAVAAGFGLCYAFKETLFEVLLYPLIRVMPEGGKLIFTGIPEAFFTYLKVSFLSGILLAPPVLLYQVWMLVAPGRYKKEPRVLAPIIAVTSFFFIGGALFGYFVVFPSGFKFLLSFGADYIRTLPSMREYLDFSTKLLFMGEHGGGSREQGAGRGYGRSRPNRNPNRNRNRNRHRQRYRPLVFRSRFRFGSRLRLRLRFRLRFG